MSGAGLRIDRPAEGVLRLLLDRPRRHNALDAALVEALHDAVAGIDDARAVVLASAAAGMFCAGADLDMDDAERAAVSDRLYELYGRIAAAPVPFIAAVDGAAVGGGAQLAVACDLRVVGPAARLRFVGAGHGLAIGGWALPSLVGRGRALELCLTMRWIDASEAVAIGLAERAAADAQGEALALAADVAARDPAAVANLKAVVSVVGNRAAALEEEAALNRPWSGAMTTGGPRG